MWSEALALLSETERLQRQFFHISDAWEPPVDVLEMTDGVQIHVALPGVAPDSVEVSVEPNAVIVSAVRSPSWSARACSGRARVHRIEIPHGRFARRISIPAVPGRDTLRLTESRLAGGLLTLRFTGRT